MWTRGRGVAARDLLLHSDQVNARWLVAASMAALVALLGLTACAGDPGVPTESARRTVAAPIDPPSTTPPLLGTRHAGADGPVHDAGPTGDRPDDHARAADERADHGPADRRAAEPR